VRTGKARQVGVADQEHAIAEQAFIDGQAHWQVLLFQFRRGGARRC
jgi:hypothetical protein